MITEQQPAAQLARSKERRFDWPLCYEAEKFILAQLSAFLERNHFGRLLAGRMQRETGTELLDWVDHLVVSPQCEEGLRELGYREDPLGETPSQQKAFWHPDAMLPRVLTDATVAPTAFPVVVAVLTDNVSDFMAAHNVTGEPKGGPCTRYRKILVSFENGARLEAVERRGYRGYVPVDPTAGQVKTMLKAHELWKNRRRVFDDDEQGYAQSHALLDQVIDCVGKDLACHVVFAEERAYWQRRNRAAQLQKMRQDHLGLGWANHDHHTFRSSRRHFLDLMQALEKLGFERRERYYAGEQAGWGAQILEQPVEGIVAFCDVDLEPQETELDFSRQGLSPARKLGTIGLWVGLHGESFLDAGMHHLECRFDFSSLRAQLAALGVNTMKPFSNFTFLKQAFTEGERWPVRGDRAERLWRSKLIDDRQFQTFLSQGAIGSHLENLQRKGGFKGFNQQSVSAIIRATDPRR